MASRQDYYGILGLSRTASPEEVKKAFHRLARKFHPDVNPGDKAAEAKFKEINEAYSVLSDRDKREKYDRFGHEGPSGHASSGGGFSGFGGAGFEDIFSDLFGRGRAGPEPGEDIGLSVRISFADAYNGVEIPVRLEREGERARAETLSVRIPAGVDTGSRVRLSGKGNPGGRGGAAGDLYILVEVAPHRFFRREGPDVLLDLPLTFAEAALGAKVSVPLPAGGEAEVTIPAGTQCGHRLRLRGKGFPGLHGAARGDLFAVVTVAVPKKVPARAKELIEQLAALLPKDEGNRRW
jgi:curved DNA-binding protein